MPTPPSPQPESQPQRAALPVPEPQPAPRTWTWVHLGLAALVFLLPLLLFVGLAEDVVEYGSLSFDRPLMLWLHEHSTPGLTLAMKVITELGGLVAVPVIAIVLSGLLWRRGRRRDATLLAATVVGATLLNTVLKAVFQRARPDFWEHLVVENSYSFPSGHAMASMSIAASLAVIAWSGRWRWAAIVLGAVYVLLVGLSRMYLGVHFPSDILAGWCVALSWLVVVLLVLELSGNGARRPWSSRRAPRA